MDPCGDERHYLFTLTAGRTGTAYLANLMRHNLRDAEVHHERFGFDQFGVETPDLSDMTLFNSQGNVAKVQGFWAGKLARIRDKKVRYYVETSHLLMKAGLVENIRQLGGSGAVHFVVLARDLVDTIVSYRRRMDFINRGNMWLWYLDPRYPRVIVDYGPFEPMGWEGIALWYLCEVQTRAEYYRLLLADESWVQFHDVQLDQLNDAGEVSTLLDALGQKTSGKDIIIPPPANQNPPAKGVEGYRASIEKLVEGVEFDARALASDYFTSGRRL